MKVNACQDAIRKIRRDKSEPKIDFGWAIIAAVVIVGALAWNWGMRSGNDLSRPPIRQTWMTDEQWANTQDSWKTKVEQNAKDIEMKAFRQREHNRRVQYIRKLSDDTGIPMHEIQKAMETISGR